MLVDEMKDTDFRQDWTHILKYQLLETLLLWKANDSLNYSVIWYPRWECIQNKVYRLVNGLAVRWRIGHPRASWFILKCIEVQWLTGHVRWDRIELLKVTGPYHIPLSWVSLCQYLTREAYASGSHSVSYCTYQISKNSGINLSLIIIKLKIHVGLRH